MARGKLALVGLVLALTTSLASPAIAQAEPLWWEDEGKVEKLLEAPKEAGPQPVLTFTFEGGLKVGPCTWGIDHQWEAVLFNGEEAGEGKFYKGSFENPCPTNLMGCTADVTPEDFQWLLKATEEEGPVVDISEVSFGIKFTGTCALLGTTTASGNLNGVFFNDNSVITFNEAGGLTANGKEVKVDGEIGFGTRMTLK